VLCKTETSTCTFVDVTPSRQENEADYGEGKLFIFGPKITFRAQPHGTFGFLFNSIYYGAAN